MTSLSFFMLSPHLVTALYSLLCAAPKIWTLVTGPLLPAPIHFPRLDAYPRSRAKRKGNPMSELPPGVPSPEPSDDRSAVDQTVDIARTTFSVIKSIVFIVPLLVLVIVVALSLMGPAIGNVFSNIVSSL